MIIVFITNLSGGISNSLRTDDRFDYNTWRRKGFIQIHFVTVSESSTISIRKLGVELDFNDCGAENENEKDKWK